MELAGCLAQGGFWLALTLLVTRVGSADDLNNTITPDGAALVALRLHAWTDFHELLLSSCFNARERSLIPPMLEGMKKDTNSKVRYSCLSVEGY